MPRGKCWARILYSTVIPFFLFSISSIYSLLKVSASPGKLLEMKTLRFIPRPFKSEPAFLTKSPITLHTKVWEIPIHRTQFLNSPSLVTQIQVRLYPEELHFPLPAYADYYCTGIPWLLNWSAHRVCHSHSTGIPHKQPHICSLEIT